MSNNAADSALESTESDDEFQICEICSSEEVLFYIIRILDTPVYILLLLILAELQERKKLLKCSCCGQLVHPGCLVPPITDVVGDDWSCHSCKEKTDEYIQSKVAYLTELLKRLLYYIIHTVEAS